MHLLFRKTQMTQIEQVTHLTNFLLSISVVFIVWGVNYAKETILVFTNCRVQTEQEVQGESHDHRTPKSP